MESASGTVRSIVSSTNTRRAIVEVDVSKVCPRCASGTGCGAGLLTGSGGIRRIEATIGSNLEIREGDRVRIALKPRDLLHASTAAYGLPLIGAIVASTLAFSLVPNDAGAAAIALFGCMAGAFASRWYLHRTACMDHFVPTISARLGSAAEF